MSLMWVIAVILINYNVYNLSGQVQSFCSNYVCVDVELIIYDI